MWLFYFFYHHTNWIGFVLQLTDLILFATIILMFYDLCVFSVVVNFAFTFFYSHILKCIGKKYLTIVKKQRTSQKLVNNKCSYKDRMKTQLIIARYFYQHAASLSSIFYVNNIFVSPVLYIFTLTNLVFSAYLIVFIWFQKLPPNIFLLLFCVWLLDIIFYHTAILIIANLNEVILLLAKPFYSMLSILDRKYLNIKKRWKMFTYYELLNRSTKPLLINIGPLGNLTHSKVFEVSSILIFFSSKYLCLKFIFFLLIIDDKFLFYNLDIFLGKIYKERKLYIINRLNKCE